MVGKLGHGHSTCSEVAFLERIRIMDRMVKEQGDLRGALHAFESARRDLKEVLTSVSPGRAHEWRMLWHEYEINATMIRVSSERNAVNGPRLLSLSLCNRD